MKIVSVGEITIDHYLRQKQTYIGGISLNFAVNAKRAGAEKASLVSCAGTIDGHLPLEALAREGVDSTHVAILEGLTAECAIDVDEYANRSFPPEGYHLHVLSQLELTPPIIDFVNQHDLVAMLYYSKEPDRLIKQMLAAAHPDLKFVIDFGDWSDGRKKPLDPNLLNQIDIGFFSGDEASISYFEPLAAESSCLFVVTLGAAGSVVITPEKTYHQKAIEVTHAVDSTGCGDAFQGTFTVSYFRDHDIGKALETAAQQAADVIKHYGAFSQNSLDYTHAKRY